jgi:putative addiction module killer protein
MQYAIREYLARNGRNPFREWLDDLPKETSGKIQARLLRLSSGGIGDIKSVGYGVFEARLIFGPGYRIYFGFAGRKLIILLAGGHKGTQRDDILRARRYWLDFQERD